MKLPCDFPVCEGGDESRHLFFAICVGNSGMVRSRQTIDWGASGDAVSVKLPLAFGILRTLCLMICEDIRVRGRF
jgi:hypothetical protein